MTGDDVDTTVKFPKSLSAVLRFAAFGWILVYPVFLVACLVVWSARSSLFETLWLVRDIWFAVTVKAFACSLTGVLIAAVILSAIDDWTVVAVHGIGKTDCISLSRKFVRWEQIRSVKTLSAFGLLYLHVRHSARGLPMGIVLPVRNMRLFVEVLTRYVPEDCPLRPVLPRITAMAPSSHIAKAAPPTSTP